MKMVKYKYMFIHGQFIRKKSKGGSQVDGTKSDWELCVDFHGHECLGLAIGYCQAKLGLEELQVEKAADEELLAVIEADACGVDAVQYLTGCTIGKGNLIFRDTGKMALTLANRKTESAVRILFLGNILPEDKKLTALRQKNSEGKLSGAEQSELLSLQKERIQAFIAYPKDKMFSIRQAKMPQIEKARHFQTVVCSKCHEPFAEVKARLTDGRIVCPDCSAEYSRGW